MIALIVSDIAICRLFCSTALLIAQDCMSGASTFGIFFFDCETSGNTT